MAADGLTRRRALGIAMGGLGAVCGLAPAPLSALANLAFPAQPMVLTRRLSRGLRDGKAVVVERGWRIRFAPQGRGAAISGEQIHVAVTAPEVLSGFAEIEQARSTQYMFPILLGVDGTIVAAGSATGKASLGIALEAARELLGRKGFSYETVAEQIDLMAKLQEAGSSLLDTMPGDLFYPSTEPLLEARALELGNGMVGEFAVRWEASTHAGEALLRHARREVTTRIGESLRVSSEEWTLAAA